MKNLITILCLCLFLFSFLEKIKKESSMEAEPLKTFLKGSWIRTQQVFQGVEFINENDTTFNSYQIFDDDKSIYYSFNNNGTLTDYLESYIQYDKIKIPFINHEEYRLIKSYGIVISGFKGMFSDNMTWKELVEGKGVWRIVPLSKDKIRIIFSEQEPYSHETYVRLNSNQLPYYLKEMLD